MGEKLLELAQKHWGVQSIGDLRFMPPAKTIKFIEERMNSPEELIEALLVLVLSHQATAWHFAQSDHMGKEAVTLLKKEFEALRIDNRFVIENSVEVTAEMERQTRALKLQWGKVQEALESHCLARTLENNTVAVNKTQADVLVVKNTLFEVTHSLTEKNTTITLKEQENITVTASLSSLQTRFDTLTLESGQTIGHFNTCRNAYVLQKAESERLQIIETALTTENINLRVDVGMQAARIRALEEQLRAPNGMFEFQ